MMGSSAYTCSTIYVKMTLATKGFEKIDKNMKCHFLLFSPTLNAV